MDLPSFVAMLDEPPAAEPVAVDWDAVGTWLGVQLPGDYKALATAYGPLFVGNWIWVQTPCRQEGQREHDYGTWLRQTHRTVLIHSRDSSPPEHPLFYPDAGGLLAWGKTRGGVYLFWDTAASADPGRWPVVMYDMNATSTNATPWRRYDLTTLALLFTAINEGLDLCQPGRRLGPLPATAQRTRWLADAVAWTPPPPRPPIPPERRAALADGSGLAALQALIPPPNQPFLGDGTWDGLARALGTRLPAEYVVLMTTYGAGTWRNWLRTFIPLRPTFLTHVNAVLDGYRSLREEFPQAFPLAAWPEPGGFLPFADSIDGDYFGWLTEGEPDDWPLVVYPRHADQGPPMRGGLVDTLLEWSRGRLESAGFAGLDPRDDPLEFATFEPADAEWSW